MINAVARGERTRGDAAGAAACGGGQGDAPRGGAETIAPHCGAGEAARGLASRLAPLGHAPVGSPLPLQSRLTEASQLIGHGWSKKWDPGDSLAGRRDTTGDGFEPLGGGSRLAAAAMSALRGAQAREHGISRLWCDGAGGSTRGGRASDQARERGGAREESVRGHGGARTGRCLRRRGLARWGQVQAAPE